MVIARHCVLLGLILVFVLGMAPTSGAHPRSARILVKLPEGDNAAATRLAATLGGRVVDRVAPLDLWVLEAPGAGAVLANRAAHMAGVAWAEPDGVARIAGAVAVGDTAAPAQAARLPDDPRLGEQWHHAQIGSRSAWGRARRRLRLRPPGCRRGTGPRCGACRPAAVAADGHAIAGRRPRHWPAPRGSRCTRGCRCR